MLELSRLFTRTRGELHLELSGSPRGPLYLELVDHLMEGQPSFVWYTVCQLRTYTSYYKPCDDVLHVASDLAEASES